MRRQISQHLTKIITVISTAMDRAPTIARKRDESSVASKLRKVYGRLSRSRTIFPKTGPRGPTTSHRRSVVHGTLPVPAGDPMAFAHLPSLDTVDASEDGWNDNWAEDFEASETTSEMRRSSVGEGSVYTDSVQESETGSEQVGGKSVEETEAEIQKRKEMLKAKREAKEAELRLKREQKKKGLGKAAPVRRELSSEHVLEAESTFGTSTGSMNLEHPVISSVSSSANVLNGGIPSQKGPLPSAIINTFGGEEDRAGAEEVDYFKDMEPQIPAPTSIAALERKDSNAEETKPHTPTMSSRIAMQDSSLDLVVSPSPVISLFV